MVRPNKGRLLGEVLADFVAEKIGSWAFLVWSTTAMAVWIAVNSVDWWLQVDPPPFQGWNLLLSWWAGCTVSILLISDKRRAEADRRMLHQMEMHARQSEVHARATLAAVLRLEKRDAA